MVLLGPAPVDFNCLRLTSHRCEERFVGYGGNKAACLYEMYLGSGMSFYVLPDFVIHQSHPYDEETRKAEVRLYSESNTPLTLGKEEIQQATVH